MTSMFEEVGLKQTECSNLIANYLELKSCLHIWQMNSYMPKTNIPNTPKKVE